VGPPEQLVASLERCASSAALVMSHHYEHDRAALRALLRSATPYIGMLGPQRRTARMLDELARDGVALTAEALARIHAPVGLDLGANGPHEIALSIVAEVQAVLAGGSGAPRRGSPPIASAR
jgi:xanthine dehydrogenase accessory factor